MERRSFAAGVSIGASLIAGAFFAGAVALQDGGMPGLAEGEQALTGENLGFVTGDLGADPLEVA